jgi:protein-tyrosine phosphatase
MKEIAILFVCMGNICRSPTAEGVFRKFVAREGLTDIIRIDSAGTHGYHVGNPPDPRAIGAALARGVNLGKLRARRFDIGDFYAFQRILVMDEHNYACVQDLRPPDAEASVGYFLDYAPHLKIREVPDPYYGGPQGFERVLDMIEDAAEGLLADLRRTLKLPAS